jgi:hypothetical protein
MPAMTHPVSLEGQMCSRFPVHKEECMNLPKRDVFEDWQPAFPGHHVRKPSSASRKRIVVAVLAMLTTLGGTGCGDDTPATSSAPPVPPVYDSCNGIAEPFDPGLLGVVDPLQFLDVFIQKLPQENAVGNVALHAKLPPPRNPELGQSLMRVVGDPASPMVMFRSDALVKLGHLPESPGPEFFTAVVQLDPAQLEKDAAFEENLARSTPQGTEKVIVFNGRSPIALTTSRALDADSFVDGGLISLGTCRVRPVSNEQTWGQSLFITDPAVVQDPARTYDACTGQGNPDGTWTFNHLMTEMAQDSGYSPEDFTRRWLELWLAPQVINGDLVDPRPAMDTKVIQPWLAASGGKQLDLDIAPFRLLAIVNRADMRRTANSTGGYGGGGPENGGELRFVFGVVTPPGWSRNDTCELQEFTVIMEYGVPRQGCSQMRDWARSWTRLNQFGGFNANYLAHLEGLTESVVRFGAAPDKGNQNAINQIRTNEIALGDVWEMREFTLTDESHRGDIPASGLLRMHTVAQTPNDAVFSPTPDPIVDQFVQSSVIPRVRGSVNLSASPPQDCSSQYKVPLTYLGLDFRGGNALVDPPGFWEANVGARDADVCGRHQFSLNTCQGCHRCDTATSFTHVDPTSGIPARLSGFLLGVTVPDTQFGAPSWHFADLARRFEDLYDLACASCVIAPVFIPEVLTRLERVPFDPPPEFDPPFKIGPVTDLAVVNEIFVQLGEFVDRQIENVPIAESFAGGEAIHVH